jgi:cytochrome c-type biogenesis protein CcmF
LGYLISAFWAGQEGSFLLWALVIALLGVVFLKSARNLEAHAMIAVNAIQAFFLLILLKASPFALQAHSPAEGAGLNPLLQNPWMVIHPPILFVGYAAITFPLAIALAALLKRQYDQWIKIALPWVLFSSLTLGAGIIIGGYWAYGVLGWGGYWGWDPVENSSLIAWLVVLALFHGTVIGRRSGALHKTNFLLAILAMGLVLYATFLTRSGVLADFSVHSFQDLGINAYLIIGMISLFAFGFWILFARAREIPRVPIDWSALNRENALVGAIGVLLASAFFTLIGTSSPILTGLVGNPGQVDISFYDKVNLPIGILMSLLLGMAPFLMWKEMGFKAAMNRWLPSLTLAVLSTIAAVLLGMKGAMMIVFLAVAFLALWSNLINFIKTVRLNWLNSGATLAHVGVGLLFLGVIASATLDESERVALIKDVPSSAMGYELVYKGDTPRPDGKTIINIDVASEGVAYQAQPRLYENTYSEGIMREPDVKSKLLYDIYISPLEKRETNAVVSVPSISLRKGEHKQFAGYDLLFTDFEMGNHSEGGDFRVGAKVEFNKDGKTHTITPAIILSSGTQRNDPAELPEGFSGNGGVVKVILSRVNADQKLIQLAFEGLGEKTEEQPDQLLVQISRKPFMNILWLGCILLSIGTIIAMKKRFSELAWPG